MIRHSFSRLFLFLLFTSAWFHPSTILAQGAGGGASQGETIDESARVVLRGNRHPLATAANDRGEVDPNLPMERMLLVLKRDTAAQSAFDRLLAEQHDKSSANFHRWLTAAQIGEAFGPAAADVQIVAAWLVSHGFHVNRTARSGMLLEFGGTAGQVKEAFHTPIHAYAANGKTHFANAADPQIPAALASLVAGISTLHNFEKHPAALVLGSVTRIGSSSLWQPDFTFNGESGPAHYVAPGDFAKIYSTAALYSGGIDGTGQSVAIVARSNLNLSDVQIFRIAFGLPPNDPQIILDGADPGNLGGGEESEADLDVEWSGAVAPGATIKMVVSASTNSTDGVDLSAEYIVDNNLAPVMSASFNQCEANLGAAENQFFYNLWEQAAAQGITVAVAAGDNGAAGCDNPDVGAPASGGFGVNGLASTPFNIAVGGTEFDENGADSSYWSLSNGPDQSSVLGYIPEVVWNESCLVGGACTFTTLYASSGGASALYSKPPWQSGPGVPVDGQRDLPDVSLAAAAGHDGYLFCQEGICATDGAGQLVNANVVGGTSVAAPAFAGIMALIAQQTNSRLGQANFVLYPLAAAQNAAACNATGGAGFPQSQCIFNDTTQGNNSVPGLTGFSAGAGYDQATGLGSVNAANLAASWSTSGLQASTTTLAIDPPSATHGQPVSVIASVTPAAGLGTPTGEVALLTSTGTAMNLGPLVNGTAFSSTLILPGGAYTVTAAYSGDGTYLPSTSSPMAVGVQPEASIMSISIIGGSQSGFPITVTSTYSAFLELQIQVSGLSGQGNATGTVTIFDTFNGNTVVAAVVPLNVQGLALIPMSTLALGTHMLSPVYSGDASLLSARAATITVVIGQGSTETIAFVPQGALPGSAVTLEAIVFPLTGSAGPTGAVQFFDGATTLGPPVPVKNFVATFTATSLATGTHSITASYSGDSNFLTSTSSPATLIVGNPNFLIATNPGNLTVASGAPASAQLVVSQAPGLQFYQPISFSCSGLPASVTCNFQPATVSLNGGPSATATVTFTKTSAAAANRGGFVLARPAAGMLLASALLFLWPWRHRSPRPFAAFILLACLATISACGGGSSTSSPLPPTPSAPSATIVTITASGGIPAVTHTVTLAVTVD